MDLGFSCSRLGLPAAIGGLLLSTFNSAWADCSPLDAYSSIESAEINRSADSARLQNPILDQLNKLASTARNNSKPLGESLSYQDNATFTRLSITLLAMQINDYIESDRARDAEFTYKMTDEAWKQYADPSFSAARGDIPWAVLNFSNLMMPSIQMVSATTEAGCTMDSALAAQAQQSLSRFLGMAAIAKQASDKMAELRAKYHVQANAQLPSDKMSSEDQETETVARVSMAPVLREKSLLLSLENIRVWWSTCILIYQSRLTDVRTYGPSWDVIGNTMHTQVSTLSPETRTLIGLWQNVDVRYPSEERKDLLMIAKMQQMTSQKQ